MNMKNTKPKIFLKTDICNIINDAIAEINVIRNKLDNIETEQWLLKAIYIYGYTIYESTLYKTYYRFLCAFPERIKIEDKVKFDKELYEKSLVIPFVEYAASKFAQNFGHGSMQELLEKYNEVTQIAFAKSDITRCSLMPLLNKYKTDRNTLAHQGRIESNLSVQDVIKNLRIIQILLEKIKKQTLCKYKRFDKPYLIKNSWQYLFNDDGLLQFERCWNLRHNTLYVNKDYLDRIAGILSSSEKMMLLLFMANYNPLICKDSLSINDITPIAGLDDCNKDKVAYIIELFMKYPVLLQSEI